MDHKGRICTRDLTGGTQILAYYRQEKIVKNIVEYRQLFLQTNESNHSQSEAYNHFIVQFEPRGVVEIALETDKSLI